MLRAVIANFRNRSNFSSRKLVFVHWFRPFTIFLVGLFYTCAVVEVDLGEIGDCFGDVYDTYVLATPTQSPKPALVVCREIFPAPLVLTSQERSLALSANWSIVLALCPLMIYGGYRPPRYKPLYLLNAIWRL